MIQVLMIYLVAINAFAFIAYGVDKWKAKRAQWRIPEATLLGLAAIGGALGAYVGMKTFRHKTRHKKITMLVPLFLILWTVGLTALTGVQI